MLKRVLAAVIRRLGRNVHPAGTPQYTCSPAQDELVSDIEVLTKMFQRRNGVSRTFQMSAPKCLYWLGTAIITNHTVQQFWRSAVLAQEPPPLCGAVPDEVFLASVTFIYRRYLPGQCALSICVDDHAWEAAQEDLDPQSLNPLLTRVLRGAGGSCITRAIVAEIDLELKLSLALDPAHPKRVAAESKLTRVWAALSDLSVGVLCKTNAQEVYLRKYTRDVLPRETVHWLRDNRVPSYLWGIAATRPEQVPHPDAPNLCGTEPVDDQRASEGGSSAVLEADTPKAAPAPVEAAKPKAAHAVTKDVREADSRRDVRAVEHSETLPVPLRDAAAFAQHLKEWFQHKNARVALEQTKLSGKAWRRVYFCREAAGCGVKFDCTYFLSGGTLPANTCLVVRRGEHQHREDPGRLTRVWTPRQEALAVEYCQEHAHATVRGLCYYVANKDPQKGKLPSDDVVSNWLRKQRKKIRSQQTAPSDHVETAKFTIAEWAQDREAMTVHSLRVLSPYVLTGERVCILFACDGMLQRTIQRYAAEHVHLAADGKYQVSQKGWNVFTVSLLVKDLPRSTHLAHSSAKSVQGKATTTRAFPLLQALCHSESAENVTTIFQYLVTTWNAQKGGGESLERMVSQLHKDFSDTIEAARRTVFPESRPVNDYFHLKQKEKTIAGKCCKLELRKTRWVKIHYDWIMAVLASTRFAPHPAIMSVLWQGFMVRLITYDEIEVVNYLTSEYSVVTPAELFHLPRVPYPAHLRTNQKYFFVPHWTGLWGVYPGTASGNQPEEALHAPWQRLIEAAKELPTMDTIFGIMDRTYERWCQAFAWTSNVLLSPDPDMLEQNLLNGTVLSRVKRTPALAFHEAGLQGTVVYKIYAVDHERVFVAMSRTAESVLNTDVSDVGVRFFFQDGPDIATKLLEAGVVQQPENLTPEAVSNVQSLQWPHSGPHGPAFVLSLTEYKRYLEDVVYVVIAPGHIACTCAPYMLYAQCEHVVFMESLSLPGRAATRDFAFLPVQKKRGRPVGSVLTPRGTKSAR